VRSAVVSVTMVPNRRCVGSDTGGPEDLAFVPPVDCDAPRVVRQRPLFAGIGCELMEGKPDRLRRRRVQAQRPAMHDNPGAMRSEVWSEQIIGKRIAEMIGGAACGAFCVF
jgi:hypothetical protein